MKKWMVLMIVVCASVLVGCPEGMPNNPGDEIYTGPTGKLVIQGNIYSDAMTTENFESLKYLPGDSSKALGEGDNSLPAISEALVEKIDWMYFTFERLDPGSTRSYPESYNIYVNDDGSYSGSVDLPIGEYSISARAQSSYGVTLYNSETTAEVVADLETPVDVVFRLALRVSFQWQIPGLPGTYPSYGQAIVVTREDGNWRQRWVSYYSYGGVTPVVGSNLRFSGSLPVNFDGTDAVLLIDDQQGNQLSSALSADFNVYNAVDGEMVIPYSEPVNVGTLLVGISFDHDTYVYGVEACEYFENIQSAIWSANGPINVELGPGFYSGFYVPYDRSVAIVGQGPDLTIINNDEPDQSWAIRVEQPYWYKSLKGGGGPMGILSLNNLMVQNGSGRANSGPADAAVLLESPYGQLQMENVWVHSASNNCLTVTNGGTVDVNHCVFTTWNRIGNGITILGGASVEPNQSSVRNSILYALDTALVLEDPIETFEYNCLYACNQLLDCPGCEPSTETLILADPLAVGMIWHLSPDSPCIGAGDDGTNIGLVYGK